MGTPITYVVARLEQMRSALPVMAAAVRIMVGTEAETIEHTVVYQETGRFAGWRRSACGRVMPGETERDRSGIPGAWLAFARPD